MSAYDQDLKRSVEEIFFFWVVTSTLTSRKFYSQFSQRRGCEGKTRFFATFFSSTQYQTQLSHSATKIIVLIFSNLCFSYLSHSYHFFMGFIRICSQYCHVCHKKRSFFASSWFLWTKRRRKENARTYVNEEKQTLTFSREVENILWESKKKICVWKLSCKTLLVLNRNRWWKTNNSYGGVLNFRAFDGVRNGKSINNFVI